MGKKITLKDLILYSYNESAKKSCKGIDNSLNGDENLTNDYDSLVNVKKTLNNFELSPRKQVLKNIINYSKALYISKSTMLSKVDFIMN